VHVLVSFLSLTVNTENERINTFIYDDVVGGKWAELIFSHIEKRVKLAYADPNHNSLTM
jgi:hypothetical protein